jgi:hypothetical protein
VEMAEMVEMAEIVDMVVVALAECLLPLAFAAARS